MNYQYITQENKRKTVETAHQIHRNPELSNREFETTKLITDELESLNIELTEIQPTTGVIGLLRGGKPGVTVALRADIDALPVTETESNEVCSQNHGVMHACGHDFHTAALLGAAGALATQRESLNGNILFIFQPAEEVTTGAFAIIETGVFKTYSPVAFLSLHVMPDIPAGKIGVREGPIMAAQGGFSIDVVGKGGHGAAPHTTRDPLIAAVQIAEALQCIPSRWVNPTDPFVLSVCSLHSGTAFNIVPDTAQLMGTYRYLNGTYEESVCEEIRKRATAAAQIHGCDVKVSFFNRLPFLYNDPKLAMTARKAAAAVYGEENLVIQDMRMSSEDFSVYRRFAPIFMYHVGIGNADGTSAGLHNPGFFVPEEIAAESAELMTRAAITVLKDLAK